jgi:hypothetical protein
MTRGQLRNLIDPELIDDLRCAPICPIKIGDYTLCPEAAWRMLIVQTVFPFCHHQIYNLERYRHLLTYEESQIADLYNRNVSEFKEDWRSHPFTFPKVPKGFEEILMD